MPHFFTKINEAKVIKNANSILLLKMLSLIVIRARTNGFDDILRLP